MLISGFFVNSSTLNRTIETYFEETNLADMWVWTDQITSADTAFLEDNKIDYSKRFYAETTAEIPSMNIQNNAKVYVGNGRISNPIIESGSRGCLIDKNVAKNNGIRPVREKLIFLLSYEIDTPLGSQTVELEFEQMITGTMSFDECADTYSSWPIFIDESLFLEKINSQLSNLNISGITVPEISSMDSLYNQILIKTDDYQATEKLINDYYTSSSSNLVYMLSRDGIESVVLLNGEVEQSKKMVYVFPVIFLIVSILVILTTLDQLVIHERQRIGTLKSIGIQDKKILWHYTSFGTILCFFGSLVGIILGALIIPNIMFIKYNLVYSIPESYVHPTVPVWILLAVLVVMVLLGFLVSLWACFGILHKKPIECLKYDIGSGAKKLKKSSGKFKNIPLGIKMAIRNIKIKPIRTVMASLGIAGCVALLLCGFGIKDTLNYSTSNDLDGVFKYDITTTYSTKDFENRLNAEISQIDFYEKYEKYYLETISGSKHKNINVYKIVPNSKLSEILVDSGDVCLSECFANELSVGIGDTIEVILNSSKYQLVITKLIKTSFYNGIYISDDLGFENVIGTTGMWIKCKDLVDEAKNKINEFNGTQTACTKADLKSNINNKISAISLMTGTLKFFAIALAIVVLLNLIFLILDERIKEIATLKVLGRGIFSIGLSVFFEVLIMALGGSLLGGLLGFPLLILVLSINKVEVMNYLYHISVSSYFVSFAIIFVTIILVSLLCLIKVKKINMIESLKSVD